MGFFDCVYLWPVPPSLSPAMTQVQVPSAGTSVEITCLRHPASILLKTYFRCYMDGKGKVLANLFTCLWDHYPEN